MHLSDADRGWFERQILDALPDLYGAALRLARNHADAEDLVADSVAKAWSHLAQLEDRARLRGWLFRILSNTFLSRRRRAAREIPLDGEGGPGEDFSLFERLHQPFLLWWGNPEQEFLNRLLREDVERAVDQLPDAYRVVVVLADFQGLSYAEIAAALDVPVGTVRSRLARGRARLQLALWNHACDAGLVRPPPPPLTTGAS